jgi:5-methylcytosine-specific restriction endonuclease McrA
MGIDLLVAATKKRRFGIGAKPRRSSLRRSERASRHVPAEVRRQVFERDGGRCAYVDPEGRRCEETAGLELDHLDGFARTGVHEPDKIRLACRVHNQHAADKLYGRAFMSRARVRRRGGPTTPSDAVRTASSQGSGTSTPMSGSTPPG